MIRTLIIFLPFFTSIIWFGVHRLLCSRSDTNHSLAGLMAIMTLFLFYDCTYADASAPTKFQILSIIVAQAATPSLVPMIIIYLRKLRGTSTRHPLQMLWIIAPAALLTSAILLLFLAGIPEVEVALQRFYSEGWSSLEASRGTPLRLFFVSTFGAYRIVNYIEILWMIIYLIVYKIKGRCRFGVLWRFIFKKGEAKTYHIQLFNVTIVFLALVAKTPLIKDFVNNHPWAMAIFASIASVLVFFFCYIAIFGPKPSLRLSELTVGWIYNYNDSNKTEVAERLLDSILDDADEETIKHVQKRIGKDTHADQGGLVHGMLSVPTINQQFFSSVGQTWEDDTLVPRFQKLMMEEKLFLQPSLTLTDVAERLGTNKTYVSRLVNNAYNMGFPELINTLRVDYAEQYILNNRNAKQTEIAEKCGFLSASAFNNIFKKVTGMTPSIWKSSIERAEHYKGRK